MSAALVFNAERHEYTYNGVRVSHVTGALSGLTSYAMIPQAQLETARQKGVAVHKMVELWARDDLDEDTLPEWMRPVLDKWLQFVSESGLQVLAAESRVYHKTYRYAGTLDLLCTMRAYAGAGIIDIKRSFFAGRAIGLQTAAYAAAYNSQQSKEDDLMLWRGALRLHENAPYRFELHENNSDFQNFLVCLNYYRLQETLK